MPKPWTDSDTEYCRAHWQDKSVNLLAMNLGFSPQTVGKKLISTGIRVLTEAEKRSARKANSLKSHWRQWRPKEGSK